MHSYFKIIFPALCIRSSKIFALSLLYSLNSTAIALEQVSVNLTGGAVITGELIQQKSERLIIDIGYTILTIPMNKVNTLQHTNAQQTSRIDKGLYAIAKNQKESSIEENIKNNAESVIRVRSPVGLGSGFIIHSEGYVVTNYHVIDSETQLSITLFKKEAKGIHKIIFKKIRIVAIDPYADLALLKIEDIGSHKLKAVSFAADEKLAQGRTVYSIGSPLGLDRTVSQGIVSMPNRQIDGQLYIQSTVQTNPGNSGGPLFNLSGEVVGVINMKISSIGIEGLNFAIPGIKAKYFLDNADAYAFDMRNPNAGFRYFTMPDKELPDKELN